MSTSRDPALAGQTVVVLGGSAGIGLETARLARAEGAEIVLVARNPERLEAAAGEVGAKTALAFDANDPAELERFFAGLDAPVDHVMVTAGAPHYRPLLEMGSEEAASAFSDHLLQAQQIGRFAAGRVRPGGSLVFMGGTGGRRPRRGLGAVSTATNAFPSLIAGLALELAPIRVNLVAAGFVDTPLSARILGDDLDARREHLRETLLIGRVVGPEDVAALAVHVMANTALTGATYDIDGGQQLVE
jgi:NAD(P)-dependent dehydrogenase (short-subunit alcohol dehydrogenase family)